MKVMILFLDGYQDWTTTNSKVVEVAKFNDKCLAEAIDDSFCDGEAGMDDDKPVTLSLFGDYVNIGKTQGEAMGEEQGYKFVLLDYDH
jgi:hypothetical protein